MPIRVLWVIKGLGPGGAETLLAAAARAHDRSKFHIECAYVLPYKDHLVGRLEEAGVRTHCLSATEHDKVWPLRLAKLIRDGQWGVVHIHSPLPGSVARAVVRSMGADRPKLVTTEHNAWGTFGRLTRTANRLTFGWNDAVFAVSDEARESFAGRGAAISSTLRHGIDVAHTASFADERASVRCELGVGEREFVIGTVANFRVQKDYPNFLRAARLLLDRGVAARFVVVGQGPLENETRQLSLDLRLQEDVVFTGYRPDAVRVMAAFDVFTLASSWEGLPVALMEAMALGLPVVATDVGGVSETLTDGVDALLVPPSDSEALANGWAQVARDGVMRRRLADAARARASEFDVSRAQMEIEQTYRRLAPTLVESGPPASVRPRHFSGLDIRPARPDDRAAILTLLQRSLGWGTDPRFEQLFRWKHEANAFGPSQAWAATDGDRIVGVRIFMRWEFVRGGQVLRAVRAVDTATDPDYQGRGLFTALTLHALEEMQADGVHFVFNTPNSQSLPGYIKMGWREVGRLPAATRLAGAGSFSKIVRARVPSSHWSEPSSVGQRFSDWLEGREMAATGSMPVRTITTNASEEFYRWRFGIDSMHYRVVEHEAGAIAFRLRRRGPARELVHVAAFDLDPLAVDRAIARAMELTEADHAVRLGVANPRHGFVPLPGGGPTLTWRALNDRGMPPLSNWSLTMGSIELF